MLFSIIIPIYNAEKTLERCIQSVRNQSFSDYEIILVNDGSNDNSSKICKKYLALDKRIRYYEQINSGVSTARNIGIKNAKGEYIVFLDSDDIYHENYLEEFYMLMKKYPNCNNFWCGYQYYSPDNDENKRQVIYSKDKLISLIDRKFIMDLNERSLDAASFNKLYKRTILLENNIFMKRELSLGEDLLFNYDYLDKSGENIVILNKALYGYYCYSTESLNHKYRDDLKNIYDIIDSHILNYLDEWKVNDAQIQKFYNGVFYRQEKLLRNTFRNENCQSKKEKYKLNNQIMKSEKFLQSIEKSDCFIHPVYKKAYLSGHYYLVRLIDYLVEKLKG